MLDESLQDYKRETDMIAFLWSLLAPSLNIFKSKKKCPEIWKVLRKLFPKPEAALLALGSQMNGCGQGSGSYGMRIAFVPETVVNK